MLIYMKSWHYDNTYICFTYNDFTYNYDLYSKHFISFVIYNGPIKLECLCLASFPSLV